MDDALRMRRIESVRNLNSEIQHFLNDQRFPINVFAQGFAVDELHCDERPTGLLADIIDRANARMIESRRRMRFAPKAIERLCIVRQIFGQEFQSYIAIKPNIPGLVDYAHSARAKFLNNAVPGDGMANHRQVCSLGSHHRGQSVGSSKLTSLADFRLSVVGGLGDPSRLSTFEPYP